MLPPPAFIALLKEENKFNPGYRFSLQKLTHKLLQETEKEASGSHLLGSAERTNTTTCPT
jgi:hypothetical protein